MALDLAFLPSERLAVVDSASAAESGLGIAESESDGRLKKAAKAFETAQGAGLFFLATERFEGPLPASFGFWRGFAARYLTALCHTPELAGIELAAIPPPEDAEFDALLLNVPPIQGAEYINRGSLADVWNDLDCWTRGEVATGGEGLAGFLKRRAPLWHQVGRVCFHLAENSRNQDYPFAFMATYAPGVASGARVRYQPLSHALRDVLRVTHRCLQHALSDGVDLITESLVESVVSELS